MIFGRADDEGIAAFVGGGDHSRGGDATVGGGGRLVVAAAALAARSALAAEELLHRVVAGALLVALGLKEFGHHGGEGLGIGILQRKDPDGGGGGDGGIEGAHDFRHAPDIGLGIGDDEGVAAFVGGHAGLGGHEWFEVLGQLRGIDEADRDDLGDHFVRAGNFVGIAAADDGDVHFAGVLASDHRQGAAVADGGVAVAVEHGVEDLDGFVARERLTAPDVDLALDLGLEIDDEAGGFTQVIQHQFQRARPGSSAGGFVRRQRPPARVCCGRWWEWGANPD